MKMKMRVSESSRGGAFVSQYVDQVFFHVSSLTENIQFASKGL